MAVCNALISLIGIKYKEDLLRLDEFLLGCCVVCKIFMPLAVPLFVLHGTASCCLFYMFLSTNSQLTRELRNVLT